MAMMMVVVVVMAIVIKNLVLSTHQGPACYVPHKLLKMWGAEQQLGTAGNKTGDVRGQLIHTSQNYLFASLTAVYLYSFKKS